MRSLYLLLSIGIITLLFTIALMLKPAFADEAVQQVILINVEGLNYEGYISTPMHNLRQMAAEGLMDEKSLSVRTDSVEAAQASLLTGTLPAEHGYYNSSNDIEVESLLALLKKHGKTFQVIDGSGEKLKVFNYGEDQYVGLKACSSDQEAFAVAMENISGKMPYFSFIYVNDSMDGLLSLDENTYYDSLMSFDTSLGQLINSLKNNKLYNNSLIIVTSARSTSPSDLVPLVINGPGCKTGTKTSSTLVLDTAATICRFIGLNPPAASVGVPIYDAMTIREEDKNYVYTKWAADLKKERTAQWNRYYEIQDELYSTIHQMASIKEERQSISNFAGEKEKTINILETRLTWERALCLGVFFFMLAGYLVEYRWLKKKFMLFK